MTEATPNTPETKAAAPGKPKGSISFGVILIVIIALLVGAVGAAIGIDHASKQTKDVKIYMDSASAEERAAGAIKGVRAFVFQRDTGIDFLSLKVKRSYVIYVAKNQKDIEFGNVVEFKTEPMIADPAKAGKKFRFNWGAEGVLITMPSQDKVFISVENYILLAKK